ncbi:MAG: VOC family protein [Alphaproteobacteria bacterium]|nr:VOC family protein [Alphaproteobacteria bacterium]
MIEGLDHYNLSPADLDRSRRFYKEVLGMVDGDRPMFSQPGAWMYAAGRPLVHLSVREPGAAPDTGKFNHIAFNATDLKATIAHLERCGVEFEVVKVPPMENHPRSGGTQIFLKDPDDIAIELQFTAAESTK